MAKATTDNKSTRSKKDALIDDLSIQVKKLSKQLKVVEKERDALGQQLDKQKTRAREALRAVEKKARKELKKVRSAVEPALENIAAVASDVAPGTSGSAGSPDNSWTVTRLRAEARSRGVAGCSRMTKDQLIAVLG